MEDGDERPAEAEASQAEDEASPSVANEDESSDSEPSPAKEEDQPDVECSQGDESPGGSSQAETLILGQEESSSDSDHRDSQVSSSWQGKAIMEYGAKERNKLCNELAEEPSTVGLLVVSIGLEDSHALGSCCSGSKSKRECL